MSTFVRFILLVLVVTSVLSHVDENTQRSMTLERTRLLIISLDGFRHQYLSEHNLPNINKFSSEGVGTRHGMEPTFTTMTYPNHISIATGMYQEDHGIVHNTFFDKLLNKTISMGSRDEGQWSDPKVEPLWITATRQGKKSAVLFWPACHNEFHGFRPLIYSWSYTDDIPLREKMNNAMRYFTELPLDLIMLYHFEPDKQGHNYGPNSREMAETLLRLDGDIQYLMDRIKNELNDSVNVMIVSDHGMTNVMKVIRPFAERYINRSMVESNILAGALFSVTPRTGRDTEVMEGLRRIPNVTVYRRNELPERLHYRKPEHRLGEIVALPDFEGHVFSPTDTNSSYTLLGNHGWDNTLRSMQSIFMARGPNFTKNHHIDSLKNVDIYHIACRILNITPNSHATAGSLNNLQTIFRDSTGSTGSPIRSTSTKPMISAGAQTMITGLSISLSKALMLYNYINGR